MVTSYSYSIDNKSILLFFVIRIYYLESRGINENCNISFCLRKYNFFTQKKETI